MSFYFCHPDQENPITKVLGFFVCDYSLFVFKELIGYHYYYIKSLRLSDYLILKKRLTSSHFTGYLIMVNL